MNGTMNENQLTIVRKYEIFESLTHKTDFKIINCYRDCQNKNFDRFKYRCISYTKVKNVTNNEIINITIPDKSMQLYELKQN